jgi:hypothetical protein
MSYLSPINYQCLLFEYRRPFMFFIGDRATFTFGNVKLFPRINNMAYFSSINYQCPLVEYRRSYAFLLAAGQPSPYVKYSNCGCLHLLTRQPPLPPEVRMVTEAAGRPGQYRSVGVDRGTGPHKKKMTPHTRFS